MQQDLLGVEFGQFSKQLVFQFTEVSRFVLVTKIIILPPQGQLRSPGDVTGL